MDVQYRIRHHGAMGGMAFRCMVCNGRGLRGVRVPRHDGTFYETCFWECATCSALFLDPVAFNANEDGVRKSRGPRLHSPTPASKEQRHLSETESQHAKTHQPGDPDWDDPGPPSDRTPE